ncbi:hypothetical protein FisN_15Lh137 [Fistulifera solaris]|uniref:Uncharacterized protein n=1 Tax=Fistulifera solaris TaxID=1519565 RepID=A0A1Z5KBA1_FISSO|nr:hypothetical protein FisN_15Lh137 [Fistulifera solaris]|eukprot:GAX23415.1 hypothetical protein FisN_15Lh137 [Fistulifera solaris]
MIFRSTILLSVLFALSAAQEHAGLARGLQRNLRTIKARHVAVADSQEDNLRGEDFKGIWRSLQSDMSMPIDVPSPVPVAPSSPTSPVAPRTEAPVAAPVETAPIAPITTQSPVATGSEAPASSPVEVAPSAPVESPVSVEEFPSISPVADIASDIPSLVPGNENDERSDIPSDLPSDIETGPPVTEA